MIIICLFFNQNDSTNATLLVFNAKNTSICEETEVFLNKKGQNLFLI